MTRTRPARALQRKAAPGLVRAAELHRSLLDFPTETWREGDQLGDVAGVGPVAVDGALLDVGVGVPAALPVGRDVGAPVGTGVAVRVVAGVSEVGGGDVPVVLLGWGLGLVGLSMAGAPPEGLVVAGVGGGRTQR